MADEKSIYERWSEERLDPPFPKEWGLDEEDEAELLWPIWPLLFMGESDTEQYVEIITDNVMDVLGLEYDGENEDSKLWEKRVEDYVEELLKRRRAFAADLGITPERQKNSNLNRAFAALEEEGVIARQNFTCCGTCAPQRFGMRLMTAVSGRDTFTSISRTPKVSLRAVEPTLALAPFLPIPRTRMNGKR